MYVLHFSILHILKVRPQKRGRVFARLQGGPQRKGLVLNVVIKTPKKPNSALRHLAKTTIYTNSKLIFGRIPGIGFIPTKYNRVLIRGGRANDIPSARLTLVRGVYDFSPLALKVKRRSVYGAARPEALTTHVRRRFRKILGVS